MRRFTRAAARTSRANLVSPPGDATRLVKEGGLSGGALEFTNAKAPWVYYKAAKNVAYKENDWSGTVSCWLKLDPERDLAPGYCDPIQITTRAWNDGAFFVDFAKDGDPRDFRLGAFADLLVWNPEKKEVPEEQRPLASVKAPPFSSDRWTHVAFTWDGFNKGDKQGVAKFSSMGISRVPSPVGNSSSREIR